MRTIVITHKQCTTHITSKEHPEQPARIKAITTALRERLAKEASVPADSQEAAGIACMFAPIDPVAIEKEAHTLASLLLDDDDASW